MVVGTADSINKNQPQHAWGAVLLSRAPHWLEGRLAEGADPSLPFLVLAPGSSASAIVARSSVSNARNRECAVSEAVVSVGEEEWCEGGRQQEGGLPYVVTMVEPCGYRVREEVPSWWFPVVGHFYCYGSHGIAGCFGWAIRSALRRTGL